PHRGLAAIALPVALLTLAHRVPAGLMLPMVVATAQGEMLLAPDDLRARLKPAVDETGSDHVAVHGAVPDIGDIAGEQRIGFLPVGTTIIEPPALREPPPATPMSRPPQWIVVDAVWSISDH